MQGAIAQANLAEWRKLPRDELTCLDRNFRQNGFTLQYVIQQGIRPDDPRISSPREVCRTTTAEPNRDSPTYYVANTLPPDAYLSLRSDPSSGIGQRIATMPNGTKLKVLRRQENSWWYVLVVETGQQGWALSRSGSRTFIECCADSAPARSETASNEEQEPYWDLNGSKLILISQGRSRKFVYKEPRSAMQAVGVKPGMALFEGEAVGNQYRGIAYFTNRCGRISVPVSGPILNEYRRVDLRGSVPNLDSDCRSVGFVDSTISLNLIEPSRPQAADEVKPANVSPSVAAKDAELFKTVKEKALSGDAKAQTELGSLYQAGTGTRKNLEEAINWFRKAADQADASAQDRLGDVYMFGLGVNEDNKESAAWYAKAAEQGLASSQYKLGMMYDKGVGVEQNGKKARDLIKQAAAQGNSDAKANVAEVARQLSRFRSLTDKITSDSGKVLNARNAEALKALSIRLASAEESTTSDQFQTLQRDANAAEQLYRDDAEFRRTRDASTQRVRRIEKSMQSIYFEAPLVTEIRATLASANAALEQADLDSLRESLKKLDSLYDENKLLRLKEAKESGFDTVEAYDRYLDEKKKLGGAGIVLKPR